MSSPDKGRGRGDPQRKRKQQTTSELACMHTQLRDGLLFLRCCCALSGAELCAGSGPCPPPHCGQSPLDTHTVPSPTLSTPAPLTRHTYLTHTQTLSPLNAPSSVTGRGEVSLSIVQLPLSEANSRERVQEVLTSCVTTEIVGALASGAVLCSV